MTTPTPTRRKDAYKKTAGEIALTVVGAIIIAFGAFLLLTSYLILSVLFGLLSVGVIIGGILMIRRSNKRVKQLKKNQKEFGKGFDNEAKND
jgi:hypothetical protein